MGRQQTLGELQLTTVRSETNGILGSFFEMPKGKKAPSQQANLADMWSGAAKRDKSTSSAPSSSQAEGMDIDTREEEAEGAFLAATHCFFC